MFLDVSVYYNGFPLCIYRTCRNPLPWKWLHTYILYMNGDTSINVTQFDFFPMVFEKKNELRKTWIYIEREYHVCMHDSEKTYRTRYSIRGITYSWMRDEVESQSKTVLCFWTGYTLALRTPLTLKISNMILFLMLDQIYFQIPLPTPIWY